MYKAQFKTKSPYESWTTIGTFGNEQGAVAAALARKSKGALLVRVVDKKRCCNLFKLIMKTLREYINLIEGKIDDSWFKDGSFKTFKKPIPVPYTIADSDGITKTLEGPVEHKAGHYIMGPGPKGEFWPLEPENFHDKYDDNNDGTGTPKGGVVKLAKLADHDGVVKASWGDLEYTKGNDVIVRHGDGDYGVVKLDIFQQTYDTKEMKWK